jgi:O-antigen/teichoic acid export membrane protein
MLTGNVIAQTIPLAITPILSRLFSVEEFGLFSLYSSLAAFFMVIAAGRYEMAILLPKSDKDAINILGLSFAIIGIVSFIVLLIVFFLGDFISSFFGNNELSQWLWFLPITVFVGGAYRTLTYWSNRKQRFNDTSASSVFQSVSRSVVNLSGGLLKNNFFNTSIFSHLKLLFSKQGIAQSGITSIGMGSLIYGFIIGFGLGSANMLRAFFKKDKNLLQDIRWKDMKSMAQLHINFPKFNAVHALVDEVKNGGVAFVIAFLFTETALGLYSMTFRILTLPISIIGNAFGQVYLQKASSHYSSNQALTPLIKKTIKNLAILAVPLFLPIIVLGPEIFAFVLGEEWRISGVYAQLLSPWLILNFIISPVLQTALILGKQKEIFGISLIGNLIIFGSILTGSYIFENLETGFVILSSLEILYYFWLSHWILNLTKKSDLKI